MRIHMPGMDMTLEAAADLSTHQFKFVIGAAAVAGGQLARVNVSGANGRVDRHACRTSRTSAGQGAVVRVSGRSKLQVDTSAIIVGSPLKSDGTGQGTLAAVRQGQGRRDRAGSEWRRRRHHRHADHAVRPRRLGGWFIDGGHATAR